MTTLAVYAQNLTGMIATNAGIKSGDSALPDPPS
jgi:hypothetical protein